MNDVLVQNHVRIPLLLTGFTGRIQNRAGRRLRLDLDYILSRPRSIAFFDVGRPQCPQIVSRFKTSYPCKLVELVEHRPVRVRQVEIERLRLVQPFLAPTRRFDQSDGIDFEGRRVFLLYPFWDAIDRLHGAVEIFKIIDHYLVPQLERLQILYEAGIDDIELAGQIGFHVKVLISGFDRLAYAADVRDGGRRGDGEAVAVAHADALHPLAQSVPLERAARIHLQVLAAVFFQQGQRIDRQNTTAPQRAFEGGIDASLLGQIRARGDGVIRNGLHAGIRELHRLLGLVGDVEAVKRVLEAHHAEADRAMTQIGLARLRHGEKEEVDHVVEHTHRGADGLLELREIEALPVHMGCQIDRSQIAHRDLVVRTVQGDLGAEIR